jgi:hypothetical protein
VENISEAAGHSWGHPTTSNEVICKKTAAQQNFRPSK